MCISEKQLVKSIYVVYQKKKKYICIITLVEWLKVHNYLLQFQKQQEKISNTYTRICIKMDVPMKSTMVLPLENRPVGWPPSKSMP